MEIRNLYIYKIGDTEVHSPIQPECEYTLGYRLISEKGKFLVNQQGRKQKIADTLDLSLWTEIEEEKNQEAKQ